MMTLIFIHCKDCLKTKFPAKNKIGGWVGGWGGAFDQHNPILILKLTQELYHFHDGNKSCLPGNILAWKQKAPTQSLTESLFSAFRDLSLKPFRDTEDRMSKESRAEECLVSAKECISWDVSEHDGQYEIQVSIWLGDEVSEGSVQTDYNEGPFSGLSHWPHWQHLLNPTEDKTFWVSATGHKSEQGSSRSWAVIGFWQVPLLEKKQLFFPPLLPWRAPSQSTHRPFATASVAADLPGTRSFMSSLEV